jgi:DNA-directed RNA polymerase specialized sigma24 family protein
MGDLGDTPTRDELRVALGAAMAAAMAITRSRDRADEAVQAAFEAVMTTRPWVRSKGPFDRHLAGAVRSIINHGFASKAPKKEAAASAEYQREVVGEAAPSPEDTTLDRADEESRQTNADADLDALEGSVADNAAALAVLRCRREHGLSRAGDIAEKLTMPVEQVYRANEVLKDHLKKLRRRRGGDVEE